MVLDKLILIVLGMDNSFMASKVVIQDVVGFQYLHWWTKGYPRVGTIIGLDTVRLLKHLE